MEPTTTTVQQVSTTDSSTEKVPVNSERPDTASESPNNNNNTSASSSPKNDGVTSGLLKMLDDESILDGLEDIPPSESLLGDPAIYKDSDLSRVHKIGTSMDFQKGLAETRSHPSDDGSFVHSYSDLSETEEYSPLQFNSARQFELEFKLHESEQRIEQLTMQLKAKSMQLEQVQEALISYEEEIMQLRNHASEDRPIPIKVSSNNGLPQTPVGAVSLETAEQLSSKIIKLQQRVEELEDVMVTTKLDNAQLKETNDFLKSKVKRIAKKPTEKSSTKGSSVKKIFTRN